MNTTGFIRGYMSKNQEGEKYLDHVVGVIEQQLQEIDENYEAEVTKIEEYKISVRNNNQAIHIKISKPQLLKLQSRSPYSLDKYIWTNLTKNGVEVTNANGNYLDYVFR
ncbi:hypothetical protein [Ornithinibacillus halophilus]|uniref:Uncharacterized protein n=1 Tax=Ornithinibacillus halophilus TaxID=930117 RepID=A0A1M5FX83_9BACI|nr:hypothetical protein [Ornithinibacillus halophilus]SHF95994.1 hypothetical protein SAMN05216225_101072 [Ornithinibacillus halophilus]